MLFANLASIVPKSHQKVLFRQFEEVFGESLVSGKMSKKVTFWGIFVKIT
jgi:hypothetical protein